MQAPPPSIRTQPPPIQPHRRHQFYHRQCSNISLASISIATATAFVATTLAHGNHLCDRIHCRIRGFRSFCCRLRHHQHHLYSFTNNHFHHHILCCHRLPLSSPHMLPPLSVSPLLKLYRKQQANSNTAAAASVSQVPPLLPASCCCQ